MTKRKAISTRRTKNLPLLIPFIRQRVFLTILPTTQIISRTRTRVASLTTILAIPPTLFSYTLTSYTFASADYTRWGYHPHSPNSKRRALSGCGQPPSNVSCKSMGPGSSPPSNDSIAANVNWIHKFMTDIYTLPWVAVHVTTDYVPDRGGRRFHGMHPHAKWLPKPEVMWYSSPHKDLDLLEGETPPTVDGTDTDVRLQSLRSLQQAMRSPNRSLLAYPTHPVATRSLPLDTSDTPAISDNLIIAIVIATATIHDPIPLQSIPRSRAHNLCICTQGRQVRL